MLKYTLFAIVNLQASLYGHANDFFVYEKELFPYDTIANFAKEDLEEQDIHEHPTPTIEDLKDAASFYVLQGEMEKAWQVRKKIVEQPCAMIDDWENLLLSFTFPANHLCRFPSPLDAYRESIYSACRKLENEANLDPNTTKGHLLKKTIYQAKMWLKSSALR